MSALARLRQHAGRGGRRPSFRRGELLDIPRDVADDIAVMVSELATNCVRHTDTDFTVGVEQTPTQIRVEVTDAGSGMPAIRSPAPSDLTGRGLRIVRELARLVRVPRSRPDSPGKTVWFVVSLSVGRKSSRSALTRSGASHCTQ